MGSMTLALYVLVAATVLTQRQQVLCFPLGISVAEGGTKSAHSSDNQGLDSGVSQLDPLAHLGLSRQQTHDLLIPLEINMNDIRYWRKTGDGQVGKGQRVQGRSNGVVVRVDQENQSHQDTQLKGGNSFALPILNERLPASVLHCYRNMTSQAIEQGVYSPAAYGDRLCGELERSEQCMVNRLDVSPGNTDSTDSTDSNAAHTEHMTHTTSFVYEMKLTRAILCDPDCPFAQVQSCSTRIVETSTSADTECRRVNEEQISCTDAMLKELKCKPMSRPMVYWLRAKTLGRLASCNDHNLDCLAPVEQCLTPLSRYLSQHNTRLLCRSVEQMIGCVTQALQKCGDNSIILESLQAHLSDKVCSM